VARPPSVHPRFATKFPRFATELPPCGTPVTLCLEAASGVRKGDALRLQPRALHVFDAATSA